MELQSAERRVAKVPTASGRNTFAKAKKFLGLAVWLLRLLPKGIVYALWNVSNLSAGSPGIALRYCIAKRLAKQLGDNVLFGQWTTIRGWDNLAIGSNVSIHSGCYIDAIGGIRICDNVSIAHHSSLLSFDHTWRDHSQPIKYNPVELAPVTIQDDVWIGCGCRILSGITIHARSVVAAGCVLTSSVPPGSLVAGVPGRVIKDIGSKCTN